MGFFPKPRLSLHSRAAADAPSTAQAPFIALSQPCPLKVWTTSGSLHFVSCIEAHGIWNYPLCVRNCPWSMQRKSKTSLETSKPDVFVHKDYLCIFYVKTLQLKTKKWLWISILWDDSPFKTLLCLYILTRGGASCLFSQWQIWNVFGKLPHFCLLTPLLTTSHGNS